MFIIFLKQLGLLIWKNVLPWKRIWWKKLIYICMLYILSFFLMWSNQKSENSINTFDDEIIRTQEIRLEFQVYEWHVWANNLNFEKFLKGALNAKVVFYKSKEEMYSKLKTRDDGGQVEKIGLEVIDWNDSILVKGAAAEISFKIIHPTKNPIDINKIYRLDLYKEVDTLLMDEIPSSILYRLNSLIVSTSSQNQSKLPKFINYMPTIHSAAHDGILGTGDILLIYLFKISIVFTCLLVFLTHLKTTVHEKESRIKDSLRIMGMLPGTNILSHLIVHLIESSIGIFFSVLFLKIDSGNFKGVIKLSSGGLFYCVYCYLLLYSLLFASVIAALFQSNLKALGCGAFIFLIGIILKTIIISYAPGYILFGCLFPGCVIALFPDFVRKLEYLGYGLTLKHFNTRIYDVYYEPTLPSMFHILLMSFVNIVIFLIVIVYDEFDLREVFSRKLLLWRNKKKLNSSNELESKHIQKKYFEPEPTGLACGIEIKHLSKKFDDKFVVEDISLNIYEGQITVLLGHNGAGKSTTMSMITGLLSPTNGTALLNGKDIITQQDDARASLGLCPQHDVLFEFLTVEEHLILAAKIKNFPPEKIATELKEIMTAVNLVEKKEKLANELSGGMKRRLSLAMALIGESKIVVLDEPSSGLDPDSRREIWHLLQSIRNNRTVLMTTHFMDEADALGDRIAIMSRGVIQCCGTPLFLKSTYGAGYHLNILKENANCNPESVLKSIKNHFSGAFIENNSKDSFQILIPLSSKETSNGNILSLLFKNLEQDKSSLGIRDYGLSVTTMEEVFLKVGSMENAEGNDSKENLDDSNSKEILENITRVAIPTLYQMIALWIKRLHHFSRKPSLLILQFILPSLLIFVCLISMSSNSSDTGNYRELTFDDFKGSKVLYGGDKTNPILEAFIDRYTADTLEEISNFPTRKYAKKDDYSIVNGNEMEKRKFYIDLIKSKGVVEFIRTYKIGFFKQDLDNDTIVCSSTVYFSCSAAIQEVTQVLIGPKQRIRVYYSQLLKQNTGSTDAMEFDLFRSFMIMLGVLLSPTMFVYVVIWERESGSRHLQMITGASRGSYWLSTLFWDYIPFSFCVLMVYVMLKTMNAGSFSNYADDIAGSIALGGFTFLPMIYLISKLFKSPINALICISFIFFLGTIGGLFLSMSNTKLEEKVNIWRYFYPPLYLHYQMMSSIIMSVINNRDKIDHVDQGMNPEDFKPKRAVYYHSFYAIYSAILILILILKEYNIFYLFNLKRVLYIREAKKIPQKKKEDKDVAAERKMVCKKSEQKLREKYTIALKNVSCFYGTCRPFFCAVNRICLSISPGECFGLLGVNGAGKSTTFSMLTGKTSISLGDVFINGKKLNMDFLSIGHENMGYCPQFDSLPTTLTGVEVLTFYARMRGVPPQLIKGHVDELVDLLGLTRFAEKVCLNYSGGNKRKLSVGVALASWPDLVCLDEPSTGMDPEAKRFMWNALTRYRNAGKTIVITSHSLEECEALCTRLVIMVNGEFKCLGSSQHLKSKFGSGHSLQIQLDREVYLDSPEGYTKAKDKIMRFLINAFDEVELKDDHHGLLQFFIPKSANLSLSEFFSKMEQNKWNLNITNYNISQSNLEQVFLDFARSQKTATTEKADNKRCCNFCCCCCPQKENKPTNTVNPSIV